MPMAGMLCGYVVNGYSEEGVGQSYGRAKEVPPWEGWTGLMGLGPGPEGLCDGVCPGVFNDDGCMLQDTNQVQHLAPT